MKRSAEFVSAIVSIDQVSLLPDPAYPPGPQQRCEAWNYGAPFNPARFAKVGFEAMLDGEGDAVSGWNS